MAIYTDLKISKKNGEASIQAEIPVEVLKGYENDILDEIQKDFEAPGFRKGQVPKDMIRSRVSPAKVLEDAAEYALDDAFRAIVEDNKLEPLGRPEVAITKLVPGNPLAFTIRLGLQPELSLPDYKKIAAKIVSEKSEVKVSDEEVETTVNQLLQLRKKSTEEKAPELTDEFVKSIGRFENVAAFKNKIREGIQEEKEAEEERKKREQIAEQLVAAAKMDVPEILIEQELANMKEEREEHLKQAGKDLASYLKDIGKTEEELAKSERDYILRQVKTRFILEKIAEKENVVPEDQEVAYNVEILKRQHPEAEPERLERYVRAMIRNEKTLRFLEGKKEEKPEEELPKNNPEDKKAAE